MRRTRTERKPAANTPRHNAFEIFVVGVVLLNLTLWLGVNVYMGCGEVVGMGFIDPIYGECFLMPSWAQP